MASRKWMAPPWLACPGIPQYSIGWRMGWGEDYLRRLSRWLEGLTEEERTEYGRLFPPPVFWEPLEDGAEPDDSLFHQSEHHFQRWWRPGGVPAYDRAALERDWAAGRRPGFVFFWNPDVTEDGSLGPGCLSQWWPAAFSRDGVDYCCMEQYMMAEKARVFGDQAVLERIMASQEPGEIKALGRTVHGFDNHTWDQYKYTVVLEGNFQKFLQNMDLKGFLLGTGDKILVEASPYDRVWGIGLGKDEPEAALPPQWRGRNLVGFALMEVRAELARVCANEGRIDWTLSRSQDSPRGN